MTKQDEFQILQRLFEDMMKIIADNRCIDLNYQLKKMDWAVSLIASCIKSNEFPDEAFEELRSIRKELYPPVGGLSDFYIYSGEQSQVMEINRRISEIGNGAGADGESGAAYIGS